MRVADALREAAQRLAETSDTARLDAELLMAHALEMSRSDMLLKAMEAPVAASFDALIARRDAHEPVAYITGTAEFYGREFAVTRDVLIPRGDSETLIETALEVNSKPGRVLDMGVGSGALLFTVLAECPAALGVGMDRSARAIIVAQRNAALLGVSDRAGLLQRDWSRAGWDYNLPKFDLILCNPPYVEKGADLAPNVRDYEPEEALFAGAKGLDDYRIVVPQLSRLLTDGGAAVLEIGVEQAGAVSALAQEQGFRSALSRDLAGRPRVLVLTR